MFASSTQGTRVNLALSLTRVVSQSLRERQGEGANVWDEGAAASVEFAWFEGVGEDERKGDGKTVHFRKKHASRMRKLGVGFPTAPWAKKKVPGKV